MGRASRQRRERAARRPAGGEEIVRRVRMHVASVEDAYPQAWQQLAEFRRDREELGGWPSWCWVPLHAAHAIATSRQPEQAIISPIVPSLDPAVAVIGALGAWRQTRTIYRFHPDLTEALLATNLGDRLPAQAFLRLPEWCPYIALPAGSALGDGFFAHLDWDMHHERPELRILLDRDGILHPLILYLDRPSIQQAIVDSLATAVANRDGGTANIRDADPAQVEAQLDQLARDYGVAGAAMIESVARLLPATAALLLYLCAEDRDIIDPDQPADRSAWRPAPVGPVGPPIMWEVGWRIAARLRTTPDTTGDPRGRGRRPRAHVRRAHWHHYWTGPRTGERTLILRWVHPTLVAADDEQTPAITTIHDMSGPENDESPRP